MNSSDILSSIIDAKTERCMTLSEMQAATAHARNLLRSKGYPLAYVNVSLTYDDWRSQPWNATVSLYGWGKPGILAASFDTGEEAVDAVKLKALCAAPEQRIPENAAEVAVAMLIPPDALGKTLGIVEYAEAAE